MPAVPEQKLGLEAERASQLEVEDLEFEELLEQPLRATADRRSGRHDGGCGEWKTESETWDEKLIPQRLEKTYQGGFFLAEESRRQAAPQHYWDATGRIFRGWEASNQRLVCIQSLCGRGCKKLEFASVKEDESLVMMEAGLRWRATGARWERGKYSR